MGVPRPLLQVLGFIQQVGIAEVFVFVSSSLTKLMHFGQAFLVDFSLSPAHMYGDICIVIVIEQPTCQICRKGQQVAHGPEKKIQLKWLLFPQHLSGQFSPQYVPHHPILLSLQLNFLVYSSTFLISACTIVLSENISCMYAFSHCRCRLVARPSLPRSVECEYEACLCNLI